MRCGLLLLLGVIIVTSFRLPRRLSDLSHHTTLHLCRSLSNSQRFREKLGPLLVPRIVDTPQHKKVREYIHDFFQSLGWSTEWDSFSSFTPHGTKTFHNLIVSSDRNASTSLVIACHYDSKILPGKAAVMATDSAVPCAMMMDLAQALTPLLEGREDGKTGLKMLFFDGEEAFESWTAEDSFYGSRHLAERWEADGQLDRIELFLLLDLLGAKDVAIRNSRGYGTEQLFADLANVERDILEMNCTSTVEKPIFLPDKTAGSIEDDHIPFLERGVPILHIISYPFPAVWHKETDDESALDFPTIDHLNSVLRVFVGKYLAIQAIQ